MRILGIDPGSRVLGFAVYDSETNEFPVYGYKKFDNPNVDYRLQSVRDFIERDLFHKDWDFHKVAYEKMFSMGNKADAPLGTIAWFIRYSCLVRGLPYQEIPHMTIYKEVTGSGKSTKEDVKDYLELNYKIPFPNTDASDAAAIALASYKMQLPGKEKKPRSLKAKKASSDK